MTEPNAAGPSILNLGTIDGDLRREDAYLRTGHSARTVVRETDLRVVLVAMKAGSRMPEHQADETTSIHVLAGSLRLNLPARAGDLGVGHLLLLERAVPHDVEAVAKSSFLLTLGWKNRA